MKPLSTVAQAFPRSGIRVIMEASAGLPDVIHLEVGEPDSNTPAPIIDAAFEAARAGFTKYTSNAGLPSLRVSFWQAIWAPKETPSDVIARLNRAVRDPLAHPATRQKLIDQGFDIPSPDEQTPAALRAFQ